MALPANFRIKGKDNFQKVKENGKVFQFGLFGLSSLSRKDKEVTRFAFIVSTKISKKAVQRNRIKRLLADSVKVLLTKIKKGYDIIFLAKRRIIEVGKDEVNSEVKKALEKIDLFR